MTTSELLDPNSETEESQYDSQVRKNTASREYAEFEFRDATHEERGQQHEPLLYNESDEESTLNDSLEQKQYKLPSEGGTIFSSFVSLL